MYFFILGRSERLSITELKTILGEEDISFNNSYLLYKKDSLPIEAQSFLNKLGGTIKVAKVIETYPAKTSFNKIIPKIAELLINNIPEGKIPYGLSFFPKHKGKKFLKPILLKLKKEIRSSERNSRFINKNFNNPETAASLKSGAYKKGTDLNLIILDENLYLTQTIAIQDINAYSKRDYDKPFRDARMGMTPPKTAQMMINIGLPPSSRKNSNPLTIFDPFCGSGTILMEALLMGFNAIGSDIEEKAVKGSQRNIDWFRTEFQIPRNLISFAGQDDARDLKLPYPLPKNTIIISEGTLGPPMSRPPEKDQLMSIIRNLLDLYEDFFHKFPHNNCESALIIFPVWHLKDQKIFFSDHLIPKLEKYGFKKEEIAKTPLVYHREGQIVGREFVKIVKA